MSSFPFVCLFVLGSQVVILPMLVTFSYLFWNQVTSKTKTVHRVAITDVKHQPKQVSSD